MSRENLIKQAKYCDNDTLGKIILNLRDSLHRDSPEITQRLRKIYDIFVKRKVAYLLERIEEENPQMVKQAIEMNKMSLPAELHSGLADDTQKQIDKLIKSYGKKEQS
jgi:flagellin-specific chaperone FliS